MPLGDWQGKCTIDEHGHPTIHVTTSGSGVLAVPERMRLAAAINMRLDHARRDRIVEMIGEDEARKRYAEAWWTDEQVVAAEAKLALKAE